MIIESASRWTFTRGDWRIRNGGQFLALRDADPWTMMYEPVGLCWQEAC